MTFKEWLSRTHPDVHLTPMQADWVATMERDGKAAWLGGHRSGRSFVQRLWMAYQQSNNEEAPHG